MGFTHKLFTRLLAPLLSPLLILSALPLLSNEEEPKDDPNSIPPDYEPTTVELEDFATKKRARRKDLHETARGLLPYIPPVDVARILTCGKQILRFSHPTSGMDVLVLRKCDNYYCPWCPHTKHFQRTLYQAHKLQSLSPTHELRVINIVWSLPPPLQSVVRFDPRGAKAWTKAVRRTLAQTYGYHGKKGVKIETSAWNELGAIRNHHAIGDRAEPWPKSQPHMDMLLAAYRRRDNKLIEMPEKWPELYEHTAHKYRYHLREEFLPIAQANADNTLARYLRTDFDVDWHVSQAGENRVVHTDRAMHRIRYSCRPLFSLGQCHLETLPDKRPILAYDTHPDPEKNQLTHHIPIGPAFGQLESLREWLNGKKTRSHMGTLSKRAYATTARLAGNEPVVEKPKKGYKLKAAWEQQPDGSFLPLQDPREAR